MRVGTVLRILGLILFVLGLAGGVLIGNGVQAVLALLPAGSNTGAAAGFNFAAAGVAWLLSSVNAAVVYALGGMSNHLDDMNERLKELNHDSQSTQKGLRHIAQTLDAGQRYIAPARASVQSGYYQKQQDPEIKA